MQTNGPNDAVASEASPAAPLAGNSEEARTRRRAVRSLLGVSHRMLYLTHADVSFDKVKSELGGMSAWVEAFTLQLAGLPVELTPAPGGEMFLAVVQLEPVQSAELEPVEAPEPGYVCRVSAPSESLTAECASVPSKQAALATALVTLAMRVLERIDDDGIAGVQPVRERTRAAEERLLSRLSEALCLYHEVDLSPELNCHGMPEDG